MALKEPTSMEELVYFTNRVIGKDGVAKCWVYRKKCTKCNKGMMGKPINPKTGRAKIRAENYECNECKFGMTAEEYEPTLTACVKYTCSKCKFEGDIEIPFIRKKVKVFDEEKQKDVSVDALKFECGKCKERIVIIKKKF